MESPGETKLERGTIHNIKEIWTLRVSLKFVTLISFDSVISYL